MFEYGDLDTWAEEYLLNQKFEQVLKSKEAEDFLQKLAEAPIETEPRPPEKFLEPVTYYFEERLSKLRQNVHGLQQELETRRELHARSAEEIDYQIGRAAFSLEEFRFWGIGYNRGVDIKRNFLERQLADVRHKRRQEELRFWDDLVGARSKLRDALGEHRDKLRLAQLARGTK